MNGYRQLGLRAHDLFSDELSPDVATAVHDSQKRLHWSASSVVDERWICH